MRRILFLAAVLALATAACRSDTGSVDGAKPPATLSPGELPSDVPSVEPSIPGTTGGSTAAAAKLVLEGTDTYGQATKVPFAGVLLARSPSEAAFVKDSMPPGAAKVVTGWAAWNTTSLVVAMGGPQPDPSYRTKIDNVSVLEGGKAMYVFGEIIQKGKAKEALSVPWSVYGVPVANVVVAERCVLAFAGATAREGDCRSTNP